MLMNWDSVDWAALERMRKAFLLGTAGQKDYWRKDSDLESYDLTFAQRIGWKWDFVLEDLQRHGWQPPQGGVLDWGCGSGVAGRAFLQHYPSKSMAVWDRSTYAMNFAARRLSERYPSVQVQKSAAPCPTLLLSHILTELSDAQLEELLSLVNAATVVIWVEPGTHPVSRRLIAIRERLRATFHTVAPCPHREMCGMLAEGNANHWCHFFATSPPSIFRDRNWARFAKMTAIDLRSLPLSYLVLDKRPPTLVPAGTTRVVGLPRMFKGYALLLGCDATGVQECRLTKSALPEEFSKVRKGDVLSRQVWEREDREIVALDTGEEPKKQNP